MDVLVRLHLTTSKTVPAGGCIRNNKKTYRTTVTSNFVTLRIEFVLHILNMTDQGYVLID